MRQRPDVKVTLRPGAPRGGDELAVEVDLHVTSETPVDGVAVTLRSVERIPLGKGELRHNHLGLQSTFGKAALTPGHHPYAARFALPPGLVPSYGTKVPFGQSASIVHLLDVHVRIPWWLDRHASFVVPVGLRAVAMKGSPRIYATYPEGPRGTELGIELSLENDVVAPGETLSGAVALVNVASHRIRELRATLVAVERSGPGAPYGLPGAREVARYSTQLAKGAPKDGVPLPFVVRFPKDGQPTFTAAFFSHVWHLEVTADIALGRDVSLNAPFHVLPDASAIAPSAHAAPPPVGHERRARVWASVATGTGLDLDAEKERLHGSVGKIAIDIALERAGEGSRLVAHLAHPPLGLALDAHSRAWTEVLRLGETDFGDDDFAKRIAVRGRFDEQLRPFFDVALRASLLAFDEVHLEDEGTALASDSGGSDASALQGFVAKVLHSAGALDAALPRIIAPPPMAHAEATWRAYALRTSARFLPGAMALEGARIQGEFIDVRTMWQGTVPVDTRILLTLPSSLDTAVEVAVDRMTPETRRMIDELAAEGLVVQLGSPGIEATFRAPVDDPMTLEAGMERIAHLARVLCAGPSHGPYR
jgi:hypothetical protein